MKSNTKFLILFFILFVHYLPAQESLLWTETAAKKIFYAPFNDIKNKTEIYAGNQFNALSQDTVSGIIYITDEGKKSVFSFDPANNTLTPVKTGLKNPKDLFFSQVENKIYVLDDKSIIKMNPDGTSVETITSALDNPKSIAVDNQSSLIYYTETTKRTINSMKTNGTSPKVLVSNQDKPEDIALDDSGFMYWKTYCGSTSCSGISRANVNGSQVTVLIAEFIGTMYLDIRLKRLYYSKTSFLSMIYYSDLSGGNEKRYFEGSTSAKGLVYSWKTNKMICANNGNSVVLTSFRQNDFSSAALYVSDMYNPAYITVDTIHKKIVWINTRNSNTGDNSSGIVRCNYDGSESEKFVINSSFGNNHTSLCYHPGIQRLFWLELSKKQILSSNPDGSDIQVIPVTGLSQPYDLVVDKKNNKLIWSDTGSDQITQANLDGSDQKTIVNTAVTGQPFNVVLDEAESKLIWYDHATKYIFIAHIDGSDPKAILNVGAAGITTLQYNPYDGFIYWSNAIGSKTLRGKKDGSFMETFNEIPLTISFSVIRSLYFGNLEFISSSENPSSALASIIYPNPADTRLYLHSKNTGTGNVNILNSSGNLMISSGTEEFVNGFDVSGLTNGLYFVQIQWRNHAVETLSFIKI